MHPRELIVRKAVHELVNALAALSVKHQLTEAEQLRVIHTAYTDQVSSVIRYMIRAERHGDTDKPGGVE